MTRFRQAIEDYLKTIYHLTREERGAVATKAVADSLAISSASVTSMFRRLKKMALVTWRPYAGVELTDRGREAAVTVVRRHRIIESFLTEVLGYSWDEVDQDAEILEHAASDRLIDRMERVLGFPKTDPHGSPIPDKHGAFARPPEVCPLTALAPGGVARVVRIEKCDGQQLRHLTALGVELGSRVEVVAVAPPGEPITVRVGKRKRALSPALAGRIQVARPPAKPSPPAGPERRDSQRKQVRG
ncbi:MAG: metal-dependent transcriptional regulator [Planctomycetes bacterium]|nr:metal-dependent transcriptional regulator [Planctomycetota bacterium]